MDVLIIDLNKCTVFVGWFGKRWEMFANEKMIIYFINIINCISPSSISLIIPPARFQGIPFPGHALLESTVTWVLHHLLHKLESSSSHGP